MLISLPAPQLIELEGADALSFAQAQFCNDVLPLKLGSWQWNAWLNPQGRVRFFFALLRTSEQTLTLMLRGGRADALAAELKPYLFRSKTKISAAIDWYAYGAYEASAVAEIVAAHFIEAPAAYEVTQRESSYAICLPGERTRLLLLTQRPIADGIDAGAQRLWTRADIDAGLPNLGETTMAQFLPQALGFERLQSVSFSKGCYPGQEIVTRVHFKGGNKRHLHRIEFEATGAPRHGSPIRTFGDHQPAGVVLDAVDIHPGKAVALAILHDDLLGHVLEIPEVGRLIRVATMEPG